MPRHSDETVKYYDEHADEYVSSTIGVVMESLYQPFLKQLPAGGTILDAGCGSGRDTKALLKHGYKVTAIDASSKMVEAATRLIGYPAKLMYFQQMTFDQEFDGVWACASLLHVPRMQIDEVLNRIKRAMRSGGVCYMSFKEGEGERVNGGRRFSDFTANNLKTLLAGHADCDVIDIWTTDDVRICRHERWVNALVRKRKRC